MAEIATSHSLLAMTGTIAEFRNATRPTNEIAAFAPRDDRWGSLLSRSEQKRLIPTYD